EPAQLQQPLGRDDAERVERRIQAGHVVALRREEDVALRIVPPYLRDIELAPEQLDDDVECAETRADVSRAGALDGDESVGTAHVREQSQVGAIGAVELRLRDQL